MRKDTWLTIFNLNDKWYVKNGVLEMAKVIPLLILSKTIRILDKMLP